MAGNLLRPHAGRCKAMKTAAGRSGGKCDTKRCNASTPPAEAPTTIISAAGMDTIVALPANCVCGQRNRFLAFRKRSHAGMVRVNWRHANIGLKAGGNEREQHA